MYEAQTSDREMYEAALSVLASYDAEAAERLDAAHAALSEGESLADLFEDLYEELCKHDELTANAVAHHAGIATD
jgi:hypothetical protein